MAVVDQRRPGSTGVLKRMLVGRALASHKAEHQLLPKVLALPVFSSDPLSSVAYATEEMMLVLALAGAAAIRLMLPIGIAIATLLLVVVTSYRQTVRAYPRGGGSYIVARENLGTLPGLVAAAAILTDYVLTVAVSVTAGTVAVVSAVPSLFPHRVPIALGLVALVTLANLRGVKEAGTVFAVPTYGFVAIVFVTLGTGFVKCLGGCPVAESADLPLPVVSSLSLFVVLRAFASGATALTGVEAIADGVQAFRRPQSKNAATTLAIMGSISISMFLGITFLARELGVRVSEQAEEARSVLAQIGHTVFGGGVLFIVLQVFTAGILILAANTAYQDFPRLSAILARDRFMPSQFRNRGDRLVFSNGVIMLAGLASLLIWAFDADLTRLIQLYVVGVFTAFTLSQAGMVRRWLRTREGDWKRSAVINGIGATTTCVVLVIVTITKFSHGAWIVIAAIPFIIYVFASIKRHYDAVSRQLRRGSVPTRVLGQRTIVLLVRELGPDTAEALGYIRSFRPPELRAIHPGEVTPDLRERWRDFAGPGVELESLPEGGLRGVVKAYVRTIPRSENDFVNVVVPERVEERLAVYLLRRFSLIRLKAGLLREPNVVVTDVPVHIHDGAVVGVDGRPLIPRRTVALVFVSAVHDATIRAVNYALSLEAAETRAIYFDLDPDETQRLGEQWAERDPGIPLDVVEAPFRDLTGPMLDEVRRVTSRGGVCAVVLPEFVVSRWRHFLLHNQNALFVKRLLLYEPRVVLSSVPFVLEEA